MTRRGNDLPFSCTRYTFVRLTGSRRAPFKNPMVRGDKATTLSGRESAFFCEGSRISLTRKARPSATDTCRHETCFPSRDKRRPACGGEQSGAGRIDLPQRNNGCLFLKSWFDVAQFGLEAQSVIAMRAMKIAAGGQDGAAECWRNWTQRGHHLLREHSPMLEVKAWRRPQHLR
jgi:hypothetical protein